MNDPSGHHSAKYSERLSLGSVEHSILGTDKRVKQVNWIVGIKKNCRKTFHCFESLSSIDSINFLSFEVCLAMCLIRGDDQKEKVYVLYIMVSEVMLPESRGNIWHKQGECFIELKGSWNDASIASLLCKGVGFKPTVISVFKLYNLGLWIGWTSGYK